MTYTQTTAQTTVIDVGTRTTRAGYTGEETPRTVQRSCVGLPRARRPRPTLLGHRLDLVAGDAAYAEGGLLDLHWPVEAGQVRDYELFEQMLFGLLMEEMHVAPDVSPFLFLEPAYQSRQDRERLCEVLFESFNMPLVGLLSNTAATLYASGRTSGLVVDSGAGRTCVAAVNEGYTLTHAIRLSTVAGDAVTEELLAALRADGYPLSTAADRDHVEAAKETMCHVADSSEALANAPSLDQEMGYTLPDQQQLFLGEHAMAVPEMLFGVCIRPYSSTHHDASVVTEGEAEDGDNKSTIVPAPVEVREPPSTPTGYTHSNPLTQKYLDGWASMIRDAVSAAPAYLHARLYENVVLGGGNTLLQGAEKRVQREIAAMAPVGVEAACVAFPERWHAAWIGASIWGCSATFPESCVSKAAYHEQGRGIVHLFAQ